MAWPGPLPQLALARGTTDRVAHRRTDADWLARAWQRPSTRVLLVQDGRLAVSDDRTALRLAAPPAVEPGAERYLLGVTADGATVFAVAGVDQHPGPFASLREVGAVLSDRDAGLAVHAVALANWHATHPRCARCGGQTVAAAAGHQRRCPDCGALHFPRTDPAVIVLVTDDRDRCLLGHKPSWPERRFSTLAGFVEPGESAEQAVGREIGEEVGITVTQPHYLASQPWPFPSSLMLGFTVRAVGTAIRVDEEEITAARWFTRDELRAAAASGQVVLPGEVSIARRLIERWYGGPLPGSW